MIEECIQCHRRLENNLEHRKEQTPWQSLCLECRNEIDKRIVISGSPGSTYFAGHTYSDDGIAAETVLVRYGENQSASMTVVERDLEKLQVQANHYSHGNVAQFILDVFNTFVDRYETR